MTIINRRVFLSFFSVAPAALPLAVQTGTIAWAPYSDRAVMRIVNRDRLGGVALQGLRELKYRDTASTAWSMGALRVTGGVGTEREEA